MTTTKTSASPNREPAIQFRPGPDLGEWLIEFSGKHGLTVNEAGKDLMTLALIGLDGRYFPLLYRMALAMGGTNAFVRTCLHISAAVQALLRTRGGDALPEWERSQFIRHTVSDYLAGKGHEVPGDVFVSLPLFAELKKDVSAELHMQEPPSGTGDEKKTARRRVSDDLD